MQTVQASSNVFNHKSGRVKDLLFIIIYHNIYSTGIICVAYLI